MDTTLDRRLDATVLEAIAAKDALRERTEHYGPSTVAYYADICSSLRTDVLTDDRDLARVLARLKRRGLIRYRHRVGWVLTDEGRVRCEEGTTP